MHQSIRIDGFSLSSGIRGNELKLPRRVINGFEGSIEKVDKVSGACAPVTR